MTIEISTLDIVIRLFAFACFIVGMILHIKEIKE